MSRGFFAPFFDTRIKFLQDLSGASFHTVLTSGLAKGNEMKHLSRTTRVFMLAAILLPLTAGADGRFDLVMPTYNISAWNLGLILFTGTITVEWVYFIHKELRVLLNKGDWTTEQ